MQRDLFDAGITELPRPRYGISGLQNIRIQLRFDQILVGVIGLLVFYVLIFSFGVENGKKYAFEELKAERVKREQLMSEFREKLLERSEAPIAEAPVISSPNPEGGRPASFSQPAGAGSAPKSSSSIAAAAQNSQVLPEADSKKTVLAVNAVNSKYPAGKYTIQSVTFNSLAMADKELLKLKKKGHEGFVIPSGSFYQVCVKAFETKKIASAVLKKLQADGIIGHDAYVRPIPQ